MKNFPLDHIFFLKSAEQPTSYYIPIRTNIKINMFTRAISISLFDLTSFFSKEYKMLNIRKITMDVDLYVGNVIIFEKINFEKPRESLSICWFKN